MKNKITSIEVFEMTILPLQSGIIDLLHVTVCHDQNGFTDSKLIIIINNNYSC